MVVQLYAQKPADSVELVVHEGRPSPPCTLDGACKGREGIVNAVVLEAIPEDAFIKAAVVCNQVVAPDKGLQQGQASAKVGEWATSRILMPWIEVKLGRISMPYGGLMRVENWSTSLPSLTLTRATAQALARLGHAVSKSMAQKFIISGIAQS